jgi:hypothetical protein
MIRLLDGGLGGTQGVTKDKIRQIGVAQRHRTQEQRFFLGSNPQGHPAVVFNRYSRHDRGSSMITYTFK